MTLNRIERNIFARGLFAMLMVSCALVGVVWVVKAFQGLDIIASKGQSVLLFLYVTSLAIPILLAAVLPIGLLIATIYTINSLNNDSELVIINASGASPWTVYKPFILLATLTAIFVGLISFLVGPSTLRDLRTQKAAISADVISVVARAGQFSKISKNITFHIANRAPGGTLEGIVVKDEREKDVSFLYFARRGSIVKNNGEAYLILENGEIHRKDLEKGNVSIINFNSYAFDLSSFTGSATKFNFRPSEMTMWELFNPDPNNYFYQKTPGKFTAELHERFSSVLYPFMFVMIVLSFAGQARSTRQTYGHAILTAALISCGLRALGFSMHSLSKSSSIGIIMVYIIPLSGIFFASLSLISDKQLRLPKAISLKISDMTSQISKLSVRIQLAYHKFIRQNLRGSS
jgi:lipopolysaccharide export system permease protein